MSNTTDREEAGVRVRATETGPIVRTLEVDVDAARVRGAFDRAYRELAKRVRVRGFRPGKAPRSVLERLYGASVAESVERALVADTLPKAVEETGLTPVTEPAIDAEPPALDAPFHYTARIEVKPEIQLPETRGLPARRPPVIVTEADVASELDALRQRHAQLVEEPEGTELAAEHVAIVDYVGRIDDKEIEGGRAREASVEISSDRFIPGFGEQLLGARAGEDREVRVRFPDDHPKAELAGKDAVFSVHVIEVKRRAVPDLDDEFAKDVGDFDTLDALRQRVRGDLTTQRERHAKGMLERTLMDALLERTEFNVPAGWVERQLERRLATAHERLEGSLPEDALHEQLARWREQWRNDAERDVRERLILEAVAEREQLAVDDAEVDAHIDELARERGTDAARLRKEYRQNDLVEALRAQLRDEKALAFLMREARVEETTES